MKNQNHTPRLTIKLMMCSLLGACSADTSAQPEEPAVVYSALSSVGGQISREEVLDRARNWYDRRGSLHYNDSRASSTLISDVDGKHRYGADCSGFVSMAWHLEPGAGGGLDTHGLPNVSTRIERQALQPGDILDDPAEHVVLFEAWEADHVHFSYYSFGNTPLEHGTHASFSDAKLSSHPMADYIAFRYNNITGGADAPGTAGPTHYLVDTNPDAPGYASPGSGAATGTLKAGTNYVFCKVWGPQVGSDSVFNHWWLKTDLDIGPADQFVSAYYLSRWGNDEAKDNSGTDIPVCAGGSTPPSQQPPTSSRWFVDTFDDAPGYASPGSGSSTGTLKAGTSYVYCKVQGPTVGSDTTYNHWWLKTDLDIGPANQFVSAYYLSRWGNDEAKDNNGTDIPDC